MTMIDDPIPLLSSFKNF